MHTRDPHLTTTVLEALRLCENIYSFTWVDDKSSFSMLFDAFLDVLLTTDAGTDRMHEAFDVNDPTQFSRDWFSWADSMFCDLAFAVAEDAAAADDSKGVDTSDG